MPSYSTATNSDSSYYFTNTIGSGKNRNVGTPYKKDLAGTTAPPFIQKPLVDTVKILSLDYLKTTKKILAEKIPKTKYLEFHDSKKIKQVEPSKGLRIQLYENLRSTEIFKLLEEWVQQEVFENASIVFSGDYLLWAAGLIPDQKSLTLQIMTQGTGVDTKFLKRMVLEEFAKLITKYPHRFLGHDYTCNITNAEGVVLFEDNLRIFVQFVSPSSLRTHLQDRMKLANGTKRIMYDPTYKLLFIGKALSTCFVNKQHEDRPSNLFSIIVTVKECKDYNLDMSDNTLQSVLNTLLKLRIDDTYITSVHQYSTPLAFILAPFLTEQARTPVMKEMVLTTLATIANRVINKCPIRNDYDWLQPNRTIKRFGLDIYGANWRREVSDYSEEAMQTNPVNLRNTTLDDAFRFLS